MKAILMSVRPQWVAKILNGEKTIEIRKKFPKDYVGWVYIYCTKAKPYLHELTEPKTHKKSYWLDKEKWYMARNSKVVARFWCDKVEEYVNGSKWSWKVGAPMWGACNDYEYILKDTCLTEDELYDYCVDLSFKAIHITKLEIFDKPKEISEFYRLGAWKVYEEQFDSSYMKRTEQEIMKSLSQTLTRAPQSWCYIEI